jgi:uncharacterized protein (TIGR02246 family)
MFSEQNLFILPRCSPMKILYVCAGLLLGGGGIALAQEVRPAATPLTQPAPAAPRPSPEAETILAADAAFVQDYNRADARALAVRFSEDAEVVEADGTRYQGRALVEQRLAETFAASPGVKLAVASESIQFLSPDVAKEEGRTTVTHARGAPETRRHTAILVRRDGRWLISSIREEPERAVPPHEHLKELEWLIGEWVDQGADAHVRVTCAWSDDRNFLVRSFRVTMQGKPAMTISQRIGWDPLARQFRSWEFDSEGGYGEGRWSHDGDRWVVKHSGVRPEGVVGSATHIMIRERPDLVRWASLDRSVGDQAEPAEQDYVMVRVPPAPQAPISQPAMTPR